MATVADLEKNQKDSVLNQSETTEVGPQSVSMGGPGGT